MKNELKIAIIGVAVKHSMSPDVHKAFGQQCDINVIPKLVQVENSAEAFFNAVKNLVELGFQGLTIAQPFKELAFAKICHSVTDRANYAGAANTIRIENDGALVGENTDGYGLVNDIQKNFKFPIQGKKILLLGAGGAACGLLKPLIDERPSDIVIVNRTEIRAKLLAGKFAQYDVPVSSLQSEELKGHYDLVINATSASMQDKLPCDLPSSLIDNHSLCYDLFYRRDRLTAFEQWAKDNGARWANGVGMVVEQGAVGFNHWCNADNSLDTAKVIKTLAFHRANANALSENRSAFFQSGKKGNDIIKSNDIKSDVSMSSHLSNDKVG